MALVKAIQGIREMQHGLPHAISEEVAYSMVAGRISEKPVQEKGISMEGGAEIYLWKI
jgi:hypothetical protein